MTAAVRTIAPRNACTTCGERWAQSRSGLCRQCQRIREADERLSVQETLREVERKRPRRLVSLSYVPFDQAAKPTRIVAGVEYVIHWSGTSNGAAALGIPLAADRGSLLYDAPRGK